MRDRRDPFFACADEVLDHAVADLTRMGISEQCVVELVIGAGISLLIESAECPGSRIARLQGLKQLVDEIIDEQTNSSPPEHLH